MAAPDVSELDAPWRGPARFDDFVVVRPLGSGGMGQVLLGHDVVLDRPVALKFTAAADPAAVVRARFLREARAIARLSHPNVVGIYRVGEVEGRPYIAYEFVAGRGLDTLRTPMPWTRVARIALGLVRGLAAAHHAGVLHRDVKPSNVMLTDADEVKLLDFGLARLDDHADHAARDDEPARPEPLPLDARRSVAAAVTHAGAVMGTPLYLAPELWERQPATARTDLYALGLVLYELLTGTHPHGIPGGAVRVEDVLSRDPAPVGRRMRAVLPSFAALVDACVRRDPAARPASAEALARDLERLCALFVPADAPSLRDDADATLVAASMSRVVPEGDRLTARVYERLFEARPDLRRLFPADLASQREKLLQAMRLSFESLGDHATLVPALRDLGRRHAHLALESGDYTALGDAVLGAITDVDSACDAETLEAWRRAYAFVTATMRRGEAGAHRDAETAAGTRGTDVALEPTSPASRPTPGTLERVPATRYAYAGDVSLAWQVFGEGPRDVLLVHSRVSHLDMLWRHPRPAAFLRAMAADARVAMFDKRGTGLSERNVPAPRLDERLEDMVTVLDAAGMQRAVVFGVGEGAATALLLAAVMPERVRGVVCVNGAVRFLRGDDHPAGIDPAFLDAACERIRADWGGALFVDAEAPSQSGDEGFRAWFGEYLRSASSPGHAVAMLRLNARVDGRAWLPYVRVPTLVMHREDNRLSPFDGGRQIAQGVEGARFVALPGGDHLAFTGDTRAMLRELAAFARDPRLDLPPPLPLRCVLVARARDADAASLAKARARMTALGARELPTGDPRAVAFTSPWFGRATHALVRVAEGREARREGLRAAVDVAVIDPEDCAAAVARCLDAAAGAEDGACVATALVDGLCAGWGLAREDDGGADWAPLTRDDD